MTFDEVLAHEKDEFGQQLVLYRGQNMTFDEVLAQVRELLQQRGRVTYRSLTLRYQLDDELLTGVIDELISAERVAADEDGKMLVWIGGTEVISPQSSVSSPQPLASSTQPSAAERRQLTVLFCDIVGSTALSAQLDPEDCRAVVRAYRETCAAVIRRFEEQLAKDIGDGLLVYFGYPSVVATLPPQEQGQTREP